MNASEASSATRIWGVALLASFAMTGPLSAELTVSATLDKSMMNTDDAAVLTVTVNGGRRPRIEIPQVDGLTFQQAGQSTNIQIINGAMTASLTSRLLVRAREPGDYEIPPIKAAAGSEVSTSPAPLTLKVVKGSGRAPQRGQPGVAPAPAMPGGPGSNLSNQQTTGSADGELAFLEVNPAKTELYVGELVPFEVKAYFRAGERVTLNSLPEVTGGTFTLVNQDGQPRQERVTRGGTDYTLLTFYAGLAAVKPGEFDAEVTLDATVVVREQPDRRDPRSPRGNSLRSLFDDPFFSGFFGRAVEKQVILKTDPVPIKVAEVPADGRPDGFAGAVGKFSLSAGTTTTEAEVGEPVTVEVQVEGTGNFDRVGAPDLKAAAGWKTYPPSQDFVPADSIGRSGVKVFEQVVVPESPDADAIPPFELVFFDPDLESFEVVSTDPIPLEVTGEAPAPAPTATPVVAQTPDAAGPGPDPEPVRASTPLYARTWFQGAAGTSAAAIAVSAFVLAARSRRDDPEKVARAKYEGEIGAAAAAMDRAVAESDAPAFFRSMRRAVQACAGRGAGAAPDSLTAADVDDPELRELLAASDEVLYSGRPVEASELAGWKQRAAQKLGTA